MYKRKESNRRPGKAARRVLQLGSLAVIALGVAGFTRCNPDLSDYQAWQSEEFAWWEMEQGWKSDTRKAFWFTSQGSRMMPYDWFMNLEQAESETLFKDPANMERLGYIPAPADPFWNPGGFPIGLAKGGQDEDGVTWMGPTCAFCHTNKLDLGGKPTVIDGAPGLGDFETFNNDMVNALIETWANEDKFDRFADRLLGDGASSDARQTLKGKLQAHSMVLGTRNDLNKADHPYGFARVDAIGAIFNQVVVNDIAEERNHHPSNAPVSYPFLWGASQSSVVQWNGLAPNDKAGFGPLMRNVGEVLGVYGVVDVVNRSGDDYIRPDVKLEDALDDAFKFGYKSSVNIDNLGKIELWIRNLRSPKWPINLLPPPDTELLQAGADLYQNKCASCHAVVSRKDESKSYEPVMTKVSDVKTDPYMADNYLMATNSITGDPWLTGKLEGTHAYIVAGPRYAETFEAESNGEPISPRGSALVTTGIGVILGHPGQTIKSAFLSFSDARAEQSFDPRSYKARPLTGIWATAPYLHNGSIPNLYELLLPENERSETFNLGSHEYDPVRVGLSTTAQPDSFLYDTRLQGNSNQGHSGPDYGTDLSDEERRALLEYLKTL